MKRTKRLISLLLALTLALSLLPAQAFATPHSWFYGEDWEEAEGFRCDDCGDPYLFEEQEPGYCPVCGEDDDHQYCDSCFCDNCSRCYDHCICDEMDVTPVVYDPGDVPEVEIPDIDTDLLDTDIFDRIDDYRERAEMYQQALNGSSGEFVWYDLSSLCGVDPDQDPNGEGRCIGNLKGVAGYGSTITGIDSSSPASGIVSPHNRYLESISMDDKIDGIITGRFGGWNNATNYDSKFSAMEDLAARYKENAIQSGYPASLVNMITLSKAAPDDSTASMSMIGKIDGDKIFIRTNRDLVTDSTDGYEIAQLLTHEFEHALNFISRNEVRDLRTGYWRLSGSTSAMAVRFYLASSAYHDIDPQVDPLLQPDEHQLEALEYFCQLDERTANQASYGLLDRYSAQEVYEPHEYIARFGSEIQPVVIKYINIMNYTDDASKYVYKLAKKVPELGMIPGDLLYEDLPTTGNRNLKYALESYAKENHILLFRHTTGDGRTYILPSKELFDWVSIKSGGTTGNPAYDWEQMLSDMTAAVTPQSATAPGQVQMDCISAEGPMPADIYELLLALYSAGVLQEGLMKDENAYAAFAASLESMIDEAESLQSQLENADVDSLSVELESLASDADSVIERLEEQMSEYESIVCELEELQDEIPDALEMLADELNDQYAEYAEEADHSPEELQEFQEELKEEYALACEEYDGRVEQLNEELEPVASEIASLSDELDGILSTMEMVADELDSLLDEIEEAAEDLEELNEQISKAQELLLRTAEDLGFSFDIPRQARVKVYDADGKPLSGVAVYYAYPGKSEQQYLGKTGSDGVVVGSVEYSRHNSGWTISVGLGGAPTRAGNGIWYDARKVENQYFVVPFEDDQPVYEIRTFLTLTRSKTQGADAQMGSLRVTLRSHNVADAVIPNRNFYYSDAPCPFYFGTWNEYYNLMLTESDWMDEDIPSMAKQRFWHDSMTEDRADYYGAYLLPLSASGQLLRQNAERIFAPLYRWKDGKAVQQLTWSNDFANGDPDDPALKPYSSYAFDFGKVPTGKYAIIIVLPTGNHFGEVTVAGKTKYSAQSWIPHNYSAGEDKRLKKITVDRRLYNTNGDVVDEIRRPKEPIFALSVDAAGKRVWSIATYNTSGNLQLYTYATFVDCGYWDGQLYDDAREVAPAQLYLSLPDSTCRPLPVNVENTYRIHYREDDEGELHYLYLYDRSRADKIYVLENKKSRPLYVAFWEKYYTADGKAHYRTVSGNIDFELHADTPWDDTSDRMMMPQVPLDVANSSDSVGILTNRLYQRRYAGMAPMYTFRYTQPEQELQSYAVDSVLTEAPKTVIPLTEAAEPITLRDDLWAQDGITAEISGTAWSKKFGSTISEPYSTADGTCLRFIFRKFCSPKNHNWKQSGGVTYCESCGTRDTAEMPQIIEYVVPDSGWVGTEPPRGWRVDHLPEVDGGFPFEAEFAGWATEPVRDPMDPPRIYPAGSSFLAPLRKEYTYREVETPEVGNYICVLGEYRRITEILPGGTLSISGDLFAAASHPAYERVPDWAKVKLYAVFYRDGYEKVTQAPDSWNGEYAFVVENTQEHFNRGTIRTSALLTGDSISGVGSYDRVLAVDYFPRLQEDPDHNFGNRVLSIMRDRAGGYRIGESWSGLALTVDADGVSATEEGSRFEFDMDDGMVALFDRQSRQYLSFNGDYDLCLTEDVDTAFVVYRKSETYFCTDDAIAAETAELVLVQPPYQNVYTPGEPLNPTGLVAALVRTKNGVQTIVNVAEKVSFSYDFRKPGSTIVTALYYDPLYDQFISAHYPVHVVDAKPARYSNILQLGGNWKSLFVTGRDSFTHEGQRVYLLNATGDEIYGAEELKEIARPFDAIYPVWDFPYDIQNTPGMLGNYPVAVYARQNFPQSGRTAELARTSYNIQIVNNIARDEPWKYEDPNLEVTRDWLQDRFVDENLRQLVEQLLEEFRSGHHHRLDLEGFGIRQLNGIEVLPNVTELWVRGNSLTEVELEAMPDLRLAVLGRQDAKAVFGRSDSSFRVELSTVVSQLDRVQNVTAMDSAGRLLPSSYNADTGRLTIRNIPRKAVSDEPCVRYEYEAPYGDGKTALMTVYLTPLAYETVENAPCDGGILCPSAEFTDRPAPDNWAHAGIDYCVEKGLMNGVGEGRFDPDGTVSRAQLVTILYRVADQPTVTTHGTFSDVPAGMWYSDAIEWAAANGIVNGVGDGKFDPTSSITREQIAAILYRYEGSPKADGTLDTFPDRETVHSFAADALVWATGEGLITGIRSGDVTKLAPGDFASRAQIAAIIMRFLDARTK